MGDLLFLSYLFIYSSNYLHQYGLMDIDFILWVESFVLFCFSQNPVVICGS